MTLVENIHATIQASTDKDDSAPSLLVGWVVVAEWVDGSGERWLSRMGAPSDPTRMLPRWQRNSYLNEGITGDWRTS